MKCKLTFFIPLLLIAVNVNAQSAQNPLYNPNADPAYDGKLNVNDMAIAVDKGAALKTMKIFQKKDGMYQLGTKDVTEWEIKNKPPGWMVIAAQERGLDAQRLSHALLRALWAEERDTADRKVRIAVANENGLPGEELAAAEQSAPVQALYQTYSGEAERLGVFGAPTYVLAGERFWGQDRLDFLERALARLRA